MLHRRARFVLFAVAVLVLVLARPAMRHARAAELLVSFSDPSSKADVVDRRVLVDGIPARIYTPPGAPADAPGVVIVHGVHYLGIDEPRLERFSRAVAQAGVVVLTPEIAELSDYQVAPRSIDTVGRSLRYLEARLGRKKVGLMGMSFGGGVALLTAADPRFAGDVAFVVAVGAHDDLARVSTFFATDEIPDPSGETKRLHAHEYGATVLVYGHVEDFFPADDVAPAREALRLWLHEAHDEARRAARELSPASKAKIEKLFDADLASLRPELLAEIDRLRGPMQEVSPHGRLASIRANVYLLHGEGDTVIPATETLWLAKDVPPAHLRAVLVTPAIQHVELKGPTPLDKWDLVHFMGQVLAEADETA